MSEPPHFVRMVQNGAVPFLHWTLFQCPSLHPPSAQIRCGEKSAPAAWLRFLERFSQLRIPCRQVERTEDIRPPFAQPRDSKQFTLSAIDCFIIPLPVHSVKPGIHCIIISFCCIKSAGGNHKVSFVFHIITRGMAAVLSMPAWTPLGFETSLYSMHSTQVISSPLWSAEAVPGIFANDKQTRAKRRKTKKKRRSEDRLFGADEGI